MNQFNQPNTPMNPINIENLMSRMQQEDMRNKKLMKGIFVLYLALSIMYTLFLVINPDAELTLIDRIAGLCYVVAFLLGSLYFRREYAMYKNMNYTLPLMQLLEKTEKRYRFFSRKWLPVSGVIILINIGVSLSFWHQSTKWIGNTWQDMLITEAIFWTIVLVSGYIGYLRWKARSYPIWKDTKSLLDELKDETS